MEVEMIPMTASHVPAVAAMERATFSDPWSEASITEELENPLSLWLVAVCQDTVVGYIGSQTVLDASDILNVAVAPAYRRCGIGRQLLLSLEARLRAGGVTSLSLEVRPSNAAALALYAALGYREVGRRPRYYIKPREDALILRKEWNE